MSSEDREAEKKAYFALRDAQYQEAVMSAPSTSNDSVSTTGAWVPSGKSTATSTTLTWKAPTVGPPPLPRDDEFTTITNPAVETGEKKKWGEWTQDEIAAKLKAITDKRTNSMKKASFEEEWQGSRGFLPTMASVSDIITKGMSVKIRITGEEDPEKEKEKEKDKGKEKEKEEDKEKENEGESAGPSKNNGNNGGGQKSNKKKNQKKKNKSKNKKK